MKRPHMPRLAALIAVACAACSPLRAQMALYKTDYKLSLHDFADTVAIDYDQQRLIVPVTVGGRQCRFLLDTGAGQTVLFDDVPIEGCSPAGHIIAHDAIGTTDTVDVVAMPTVQIGRLSIDGCRATVQHRAVRSRQIDGLLGFDIVNCGLCVKIDAAAGTMVLTDRRNFFDAEPGHEVRYRLNFHVPYVKVSPFQGLTETALFDTGSTRLYAMNKASFDHALARHASTVRPQMEGTATGRHAIGSFGTETEGEVAFLALQRVAVGDMAFADVHTLTTRGESHIGAAALQHAAVAFNPRRRRMKFIVPDTVRTINVGNPQTEIAFVNERGLPAVGLVWDKGRPYKAGFRQGDVIERIDGRPVAGFSRFASWAFEKGRAYTFTLRTPRGTTKDVVWVRLP